MKENKQRGTRRECLITGVTFFSEDPERNISPLAMDNIVREISRDAKFREEVISATLQDSACVQLIVKAVLNSKASDVGLQAPGTVAEFFCRFGNRSANKKARKVSRKVE